MQGERFDEVGGLVILFEVRGLENSVKARGLVILAPEALGAAALQVAGLEELTLAVGGGVQHYEVQVHLEDDPIVHPILPSDCYSSIRL